MSFITYCYFMFLLWNTYTGDFPSGSVVKNPPANAGDSKDTGSVPGLGRSPAGGNGNLGKESACSGGDLGSILRLGRPPGEGYLLQYSGLENCMDCIVHGVALDTTEWLSLSSILSWKIPWTEEPGRLQSIGSQRVGYDLATEQHREWNEMCR